MKKQLTLLLAAFTVFSLSSCNKNDSGSKSFVPKLDKDTRVELQIRGHYDNYEFLKKEETRFKQYYPNFKLSYVYDKDHKKNMLTALAGDTPPDIFFSYSSGVNYEQIDEYTEDLSDPSLGLDLDCIKEAYLYKDANNKMPYVPIFTATYGMMVNETLFSKNNIKIPETYDELITACEAFKAMPDIYPMLAHNSMIVYPIFFPHFCASILGDQEKVNKLNDKTATGAGEYMRPSLTMLKEFMSHEYIDIEECAKITDDYNNTILRFYNGDVAMMLAKGNTFSGTEKREPKDGLPFTYSFAPVPTTNKGGYMYSTVELCFSVNKKSANLEMANEFMRFLISTEELNMMNENKRMTSPAKNMSLDGLFSRFGKLSQDRRFANSQLGLSDWADKQVRKAGASIIDANNPYTVDEAIENYGKFPEN